ncbi:MAG: heparinase II/III domain-containing protein, partial [Armatimonadota bacterium]
LDENVEAADPFETVPPAQYWQDVETAFARTSWDEDATWAALVSRPLGGHLWAELCDRYALGGTGHNHPEQGHFMLFGRGEVLAYDPGYTYEKLTRNHNTILVDGKGQFGDGEMWPSPKPGRATITGFASEGGVTIIAADPASAYPDERGLTRFDRTFVLAGPDLAVVHDRLEAAEPSAFSWLLHHIGEAEQVGDAWRVTVNAAQLGVAPLEPQALTAEATSYLPQYVHPTRDLTPDVAEVGLLELRTEPVTEATFLVPLMVGDAGAELPAVEHLSNATCDGVRVGETVVAINRGQGEMQLSAPWGETVTTDARAVVLTVRDGERLTVELPERGTTAEAATDG